MEEDIWSQGKRLLSIRHFSSFSAVRHTLRLQNRYYRIELVDEREIQKVQMKPTQFPEISFTPYTGLSVHKGNVQWFVMTTFECCRTSTVLRGLHQQQYIQLFSLQFSGSSSEIRQSTIYYAGLLGRWDNELSTKSLMFQVLFFFHDFLQNSLLKSFQFIFLSFFYKITKIKIKSFGSCLSL